MHLTGFRPTGKLHLGNYLGAIKPFLAITEEKKAFIADLHGERISENVTKTCETLKRYGVDAELESSHKNGILEIFHKLSFHATTGQLKRMTQFKDKVVNGENPSLSLFSYPVLMAADIFFFKASHIVVGKDQLQHIEFARDLHDKGVTSAPKPIAVTLESVDVRDLIDPSKKMSKTNNNDDGVIYLNDSPDDISRKIMGATTDADHRAVENLHNIMRALGGNPSDYNGRWKSFKEDLISLIIAEQNQ